VAIGRPVLVSGTAVFSAFIRLSLLLFVASLAVSVGHGQPPDGNKDDPKAAGAKLPYTAFPDLKPSAELPPLPVVAANAPPLRKVQAEQIREGMAFLANVKETVRVGVSDIDTLVGAQVFAAEVYRIAAELEDTPAKRVAWYEARVRTMKESEQTIEQGVRSGVSARQNLHALRFARLQAEADLLILKSEIETAKGK
jgi:hypothetical protein